MAAYKTIVHTLLQDHPHLYEQLRARRILLSSLDRTAEALKARHGFWKSELNRANPGRDPYAISSEALELAIQDLRDHLPSESPTSEAADPSLDEAITYLLSHTPTA